MRDLRSIWLQWMLKSWRLTLRDLDWKFQGQKDIPRLHWIKSELEQKCYDLSIDAGDNALYELFYYANCRGIGGGLHGACWPDILHVVLKGIIEKNLSWSLAMVYGLHRIIGEDWMDGMATLDNRVALLTPVVNLHGIR